MSTVGSLTPAPEELRHPQHKGQKSCPYRKLFSSPIASGEGGREPLFFPSLFLRLLSLPRDLATCQRLTLYLGPSIQPPQPDRLIPLRAPRVRGEWDSPASSPLFLPTIPTVPHPDCSPNLVYSFPTVPHLYSCTTVNIFRSSSTLNSGSLVLSSQPPPS